MGQPIKIYDLAKNMIKLSAAQNIEIIETGLRPGEKLYEELLVRTDELDTTENDLILLKRKSRFLTTRSSKSSLFLKMRSILRITTWQEKRFAVLFLHLKVRKRLIKTQKNQWK